MVKLIFLRFYVGKREEIQSDFSIFIQLKLPMTGERTFPKENFFCTIKQSKSVHFKLTVRITTVSPVKNFDGENEKYVFVYSITIEIQ